MRQLITAVIIRVSLASHKFVLFHPRILCGTDSRKHSVPINV